jgi:hypothetical protein
MIKRMTDWRLEVKKTRFHLVQGIISNEDFTGQSNMNNK